MLLGRVRVGFWQTRYSGLGHGFALNNPFIPGPGLKNRLKKKIYKTSLSKTGAFQILLRVWAKLWIIEKGVAGYPFDTKKKKKKIWGLLSYSIHNLCNPIHGRENGSGFAQKFDFIYFWWQHMYKVLLVAMSNFDWYMFVLVIRVFWFNLLIEWMDTWNLSYTPLCFVLICKFLYQHYITSV